MLVKQVYTYDKGGNELVWKEKVYRRCYHGKLLLYENPDPEGKLTDEYKVRLRFHRGQLDVKQERQISVRISPEHEGRVPEKKSFSLSGEGITKYFDSRYKSFFNRKGEEVKIFWRDE